jgi:hypothetical protein
VIADFNVATMPSDVNADVTKGQIGTLECIYKQ